MPFNRQPRTTFNESALSPTKRMAFGQLVIGPPGSGKSTYCNGMQQFLNAIGRKPSVVNLDVANDRPSYDCALDIRDFMTLDEIMREEGLGPNGGLLYAIEQMHENVDGFIDEIKRLGRREYLLFDCPGQIELFTHHPALTNIFKRIEKELDMRLVVVNLVDCHYIVSPSQYISVLMMVLRTMLQFNLPQINVLSKIDLLCNYGPLPFRLDFYTEVQGLDYLYPLATAEMHGRYAKLTEAIGGLVSDFGLVDFQVLAVENKRSMINLLSVIDKASGYLFGTSEVGGDSVWVEASRQGTGGYLGGAPVDIHERWVDSKREYDEEERKTELDWAAQASQHEQDSGVATRTGI